MKLEDICYVFLAARGTSDNAGLYAKYLLGMKNQLPVMLAAPSMFSIYRQPPDLSGALVMAVAVRGEKQSSMTSLIEELAGQDQVNLLILSNDDSLRKAAQVTVPLPNQMDETAQSHHLDCDLPPYRHARCARKGAQPRQPEARLKGD